VDVRVEEYVPPLAHVAWFALERHCSNPSANLRRALCRLGSRPPKRHISVSFGHAEAKIRKVGFIVSPGYPPMGFAVTTPYFRHVASMD
jgi:hypothetical protein